MHEKKELERQEMLHPATVNTVDIQQTMHQPHECQCCRTRPGAGSECQCWSFKLTWRLNNSSFLLTQVQEALDSPHRSISSNLIPRDMSARPKRSCVLEDVCVCVPCFLSRQLSCKDEPSLRLINFNIKRFLQKLISKISLKIKELENITQCCVIHDHICVHEIDWSFLLFPGRLGSFNIYCLRTGGIFEL